jgi:uncharacterized protein YbbC (DUF1343 family)
MRKYTKLLFLETFLLLSFVSCVSATKQSEHKVMLQSLYSKNDSIRFGDEKIEKYLPLLKGKRVAIVGNQTSIIGNTETHLVDTLMSLGVNVVSLFSPEHGFRGDADAGELVQSGKDTKTGLPIVSLYGNNKKPTREQLYQKIDVLIFDLQDVGVRFYTYISTLHYVMEACAENGIPVIVLDRPNPNANYVDGPILEEKWKSFVGMHTVPIVYGMTIGEYAFMINGEGWLKDKIKVDLTVISCDNYNRKQIIPLTVSPSPNLRTIASISLYPSLCLFEATSVSVGRGTQKPFEIYGHPNFPKTDFAFTPLPDYGAKEPLWSGKKCNGYYLSETEKLPLNELKLSYLIQAKNLLEKANVPFITSANFFDKLAGTSNLREQILAGKTEREIKESWKPGLAKFQEIRSKYLIYK